MEEKYHDWIYMILNKVNGKIYVGQTYNKLGYKRRWNDHINKLNKDYHDNTHLQHAWNKYGEENFEFILLHELEFDNKEDRRYRLSEIEIYYIYEWNLLNDDFGYNIAKGGNGGNLIAGKSEEEMEEIKNACSERSTGENNYMYGKTHDEEARKKMSEANVGRWIGENSPRYGYGAKVAQIDKDTNEIIKVFDCICDANEEMGVDRHKSAIHNSTCWLSNTAYGFKWRLLDIDNNIIPTKYDFKSIKKLAMIDKDTDEIIKIFDTQIDAISYLNKGNRRSIWSCLNNKQKTAYGYKWEWIYLEQNCNFNGIKNIKNKIAMIDRYTDEIVKIFNTIKEAKDYFGSNNQSIHRCLIGEQRTSYGYKWEYIDEEGNIIINKNNLEN